MNASESLRLFFALWPDDETRAALMRLQARIRRQTTPYENLHLTLAFLGQQSITLLPDLKDILDRLPRSAITLTLDRVGYFTRKRIVWAGTHQSPGALAALQNELATALAQRIGLEVQGEFKAHVTLARNAEPPPDSEFTPIVWHADQVALVKSVTTPAGSRYEVLASRSLDRNVWVADESGNDEANGFLNGQ